MGCRTTASSLPQTLLNLSSASASAMLVGLVRSSANAAASNSAGTDNRTTVSPLTTVVVAVEGAAESGAELSYAFSDREKWEWGGKGGGGGENEWLQRDVRGVRKHLSSRFSHNAAVEHAVVCRSAEPHSNGHGVPR